MSRRGEQRKQLLASKGLGETAPSAGREESGRLVWDILEHLPIQQPVANETVVFGPVFGQTQSESACVVSRMPQHGRRPPVRQSEQ
eukprot:5220875-Alexandrium_andersonii.AAC.1